jgi:hypothetical protein
VLETSLMLHVRPGSVLVDGAVDDAAARHPCRDVIPAPDDFVPVSGALWRATRASAERCQIAWTAIVDNLAARSARRCPPTTHQRLADPSHRVAFDGVTSPMSAARADRCWLSRAPVAGCGSTGAELASSVRSSGERGASRAPVGVDLGQLRRVRFRRGMKTRAYHTDAALKSRVVSGLRSHVTTDTLIGGTYGDPTGEWRGCHVGCVLHDLGYSATDDHAAMAEALGLPEWLVHLSDTIFEGLWSEDAGAARSFSIEVLDAVPVSADFDGLKERLGIARLRDVVLPLAPLWHSDVRDEVADAVRTVIDHLETGGDPEPAAEVASFAALFAEARATALFDDAGDGGADSKASAWSAVEAAKAAWAAATQEPWSPAESAKSAAWCSAELARVAGGAGDPIEPVAENEAAAMAGEAQRLLTALAALPTAEPPLRR